MSSAERVMGKLTARRGERVLARGTLNGLANDGFVHAQLPLATRTSDDFRHERILLLAFTGEPAA